MHVNSRVAEKRKRREQFLRGHEGQPADYINGNSLALMHKGATGSAISAASGMLYEGHLKLEDCQVFVKGSRVSKSR